MTHVINEGGGHVWSFYEPMILKILLNVLWTPLGAGSRVLNPADQIKWQKNRNVPSTLFQLSHPKYEFWAAKNVTCLPFSLLFSGHLYKNHSAETWGLGCLFLDYSQPGYLCGLLPTDHPLRPGSHQWTHSTALSLFRWPEQLILSKMNRWVFFFESHAMLAHQTNRSRF